MTQLELNFDNPEEVRKSVQKTVDELIAAKDEALSAAENANKLTEEYGKQITDLNKTLHDFLGLIHALHSLLGAKKDLFKDDPQINELLRSLALFVVDSNTIKLGALKEAAKGE